MSEFHGIHRVLVPLDFSESAKSLIDHALELVRARGATVRLLHVIEPPLLAPPPFVIFQATSVSPEVLDAQRKGVEEHLARLAAEHPGIRMETRVVMGDPVREILREVREWKADVVVLGTHGRSGLKHVFLGSVAENVVRQSPVPVLTVKRPGFAFEPA
jgi:nucleotide-binding universal stress UspA family protein